MSSGSDDPHDHDADVDPPAGAPDSRAPEYRREQHLGVRIACMVLLGLVLLVFLFCVGMEGLARVAANPSLFLVANVLAFLTAIPYALLLLWIDRNEQEPLYLIGTALLWGAVVATAVSGLFNVVFREVLQGELINPGMASALSATISAPFIEELTKGAAVMFIFLLFKDEFDNILDGILYGALVGLGFATIENVQYYTDIGAAQGLEGMLKLTWIRGVLNGLAGHATYTAITGCGFAMVRVARVGSARWMYIPLYWITAMLLHFLWNKFGSMFAFSGDSMATWAISFPAAVLVLHAPFTLLLAITVGIVWKQENQVIRTYLLDEKDDILTAEYRQTMVPARRRAWAGLRRFFSRGPIQWWHYRKLNHELIELAFARWHLDEDPLVMWEADEDQDIHRLRERVRRRWERLSPGPR